MDKQNAMIVFPQSQQMDPDKIHSNALIRSQLSDTSMDRTQSALSNVDHTIDLDKQMDPDIACSDTQIADQQLDKLTDHAKPTMVPLNAYYLSIAAFPDNVPLNASIVFHENMQLDTMKDRELTQSDIQNDLDKTHLNALIRSQ